MKKRSVEVILVFSIIILLLTITPVSAGWWSDFNDWFRNLFGFGEKEKGLEGELKTGPGGSPDYTRICEEGEKRCYTQSYRGGGSFQEVQECKNNAWMFVERCEAGQGCKDGKCTCIEGEKRCFEKPAPRSGVIKGIQKCNKGDWLDVEICANGCEDGACVEEPVPLNAEISVATLKDTYQVGEQIKLTDPPEEEKSSTNNEIEKYYKISKEDTRLQDIQNIELIEEKAEPPRFYGYIIQFEDKPLIGKKVELDEEARKNKKYIDEHPILSTISTYRFRALTPEKVPDEVKAYSKNLRKNNEKIKERILSKIKEKRVRITGKAISEENEVKVMKEFIKVFNGISLYVNESEVEDIKKIEGVKAVYPNLIVNISLTDSIPLINADDVWLLDEDGNDCSFSGQPCLTGEGVTIAILDTGVDYTHPDLDSCLVPPETENCFEEKKIIIEGEKEICEENDGGKNVCAKGETTKREKDGGLLVSWDSCKDTSTVFENFCTPSGKRAFEEIQCPTDTICDEGVCVLNQPLETLCSKGKVIGGYDSTTCDTFNLYGECVKTKPEDNNPMDGNGHGTHVAGIAAGNGVLKGVAPDAKIYAYKVLNWQGSGLFDWIIAGVERAIDPNQDTDFSDHADIISMSLGTDVLFVDDPLVQALENAVDAGVVAVVAAGNSYDYKIINSLGISEKVITVGATDKQDIVASFSSKGPSPDEKFLTKPDIAAPGVNICSAKTVGYLSAFSTVRFINAPNCIDEKHFKLSGTSMATPHVAGAAALLLQKYPNLKPDEVKSILMGTSKSDEIKKEIVKGHPFLYFGAMSEHFKCKYIKTTEICTKIDVGTYIEEAYVSSNIQKKFDYPPLPPNSNELEKSLLVLREDSNGPGNIIFSKGDNKIKCISYSDDYFVCLSAVMNNIPKGSYWLCAKSPVEFTVDYCNFEVFPDYVTEYYWKTDEGFVSDFRKSYAAIGLELKYYLNTTILDVGAGRLDILNALEPLVVANSSIDFGVVESSKEEKILIKNIKNEEIRLNIKTPKTFRILNISNLYSSYNPFDLVLLKNNLIEDEKYDIISTNTNYIIIPANSQVEITLKLSISEETEPGYYAGVIELTDGTKSHTIPYSFVYPRTTRLYAPTGSTPLIDGLINEDEWADAQKYENLPFDTIANGLDIYLKTGMLKDKEHLFIGLRLNSIELTLNDIEMVFDQGNSPTGNKGSRNRALYESQEDGKKMSYTRTKEPWAYCTEHYDFTQGCPDPQCSPYIESECWKCERLSETYYGTECFYASDPSQRTPSITDEMTHLMDGYKYRGGVFLSASNKVVDFIGLIKNTKEAEIAIPLIGTPYVNPEATSLLDSDYSDYSDLNLVRGDIVGFFLKIKGTNMPLSKFTIPNYGSIYDAMTYGEIVLSSPPLIENCEIIGDEDGNGVADCEDPACSEGTYCDFGHTKTCQSGVCITIQECGNNIREGEEECDGTDDSACPNRCNKSCTCLPQSKLVNNIDIDLTGNLKITLQKKISGIWQDVRVVVNKQVTIPANSLLKLDSEWNSQNVVASETDNYRVYAKFEADGQNVEASWEFKVA